MNKWIRVALLGLMLFALYVAGMPPTILLLFALLFGILLLMRDKIWKAAHKAVSGIHLMKGRPDWVRYAVVLLLFMAAYYALKTVVFFLFQLAGYDLQQELINAMNAQQ